MPPYELLGTFAVSFYSSGSNRFQQRFIVSIRLISVLNRKFYEGDIKLIASTKVSGNESRISGSSLSARQSPSTETYILKPIRLRHFQ